MSLNIKNERTVGLVRDLAQVLGASQTSAVEDAVSRRLAELAAGGGTTPSGTQRAERIARALADVQRTVAESAAPGSWRHFEAHEIYDDHGIPR